MVTTNKKVGGGGGQLLLLQVKAFYFTATKIEMGGKKKVVLFPLLCEIISNLCVTMATFTKCEKEKWIKAEKWIYKIRSK